MHPCFPAIKLCFSVQSIVNKNAYSLLNKKQLRVAIYPNGFDEGINTHLSVFLVVMKGEYDAILPWPFNEKVKFILIDQWEAHDQRQNFTLEFFEQNLSNFARPLKEENPGWGWSRFISHGKLNSRRFIVDDTLFLQVVISSQAS